MSLEKHVNPFKNDLVIPFVRYVYKTEFTFDGAETYGYDVEQEKNVRIYVEKAKREFIFQRLSDAARELFFMLLYTTNDSYEYSVMSHDKTISVYGSYSKRRYEDAVRELIKFRVIDIRDKKDNTYWYNPIFFCAGNRISMFRESAMRVATHKTSLNKFKEGD